jgi:homoserine dehydrogenase
MKPVNVGLLGMGTVGGGTGKYRSVMQQQKNIMRMQFRAWIRSVKFLTMRLLLLIIRKLTSL